MEWTDEAIVLGIRRHGEANAILEVLTLGHGRHLGLVRGGAGSRMRPVLQPGNSVRVVWRARLEDHLGHYAVEGLRLRAASFLNAAHAVYGVTHLAALCRLLAEREAHADLYALLDLVIDRLDNRSMVGALVARFELRMLAELGFGLDLSACAASGARENLVYVSPKSGRAVSREAGAPWSDRLLRLPSFLESDSLEPPSPEDLADAFALTGFFLQRHVLEPRAIFLPAARQGFIDALSGVTRLPLRTA